VPSGGYFVVSGKPIVDLHDAPTVRFLVQGGLTPVPGTSLQLRSRDAGVDTVLFDGGTGADGWTGAPLLLPTTTTDFGRSLARTQTADTNGAVDFATCDFPTPAGLNDVCTSPDTDADGLPDVAEVAGSTWNELPLFDWGARVSQKDVFVEIDWVNPSGFNGTTLDPGILPRREALQRMEQAFRTRGFFVHFDTGALFDPTPGINPANFDLGGGRELVVLPVQEREVREHRHGAEVVLLGDVLVGRAREEGDGVICAPVHQGGHALVFCGSSRHGGCSTVSGGGAGRSQSRLRAAPVRQTGRDASVSAGSSARCARVATRLL